MNSHLIKAKLTVAQLAALCPYSTFIASIWVDTDELFLDSGDIQAADLEDLEVADPGSPDEGELRAVAVDHFDG